MGLRKGDAVAFSEQMIFDLSATHASVHAIPSDDQILKGADSLIRWYEPMCLPLILMPLWAFYKLLISCSVSPVACAMSCVLSPMDMRVRAI